MQHSPIHDAPRERQHQLGMWNTSEVVREVGVHNFRVTTEQRLLHVDHRLLGIAARTIGVLFGWKVGFKDRIEHQHRRCHAQSIDQFVANHPVAIIEGEAGAGKSTFLRAFALDVLAEQPRLESARNTYSGFLPIWISFALWVRMAEERASPPSLEEVAAAFLDALSEKGPFPACGLRAGRDLRCSMTSGVYSPRRWQL